MSTDGSFIGGCAVIFVCSTLAAAGGIGGGALNVPVLISVFQYDYKKSVVLSLCAVFGNVTSQVFVNWNKRHPLDQSRPLIYWDVALLLIPAQLGGNNIGVVLGSVLPTTVLLMLAVAVIAFAVYKTMSKGWHLYNIETNAIGATKGAAKEAGTVDDARSGDVSMTPSLTLADVENPMDLSAAPGASTSTSTNANASRTGASVRVSNASSKTDSPASVTSHTSAASAAQSEYGKTLLSHSEVSSAVNPNIVVLEGPAAGPGGGVRVVIEDRAGAGHSTAAEADPRSTESSSAVSVDAGASASGHTTGGDSNATGSTASSSIRDVHLSQQDIHAHSLGQVNSNSSHGQGSRHGVHHALRAPLMAPPGAPGVTDPKLATPASHPPLSSGEVVPVPMIVPWYSIHLIVLTLVFFSLVSLAMTLEGVCTPAYWSTLALSYPVLVWFVRYTIELIARAQVANPSSILFGDVNVTQDRTSRPLMAFIIGIFCSLLGIGGGELFGPFLLAMKVIPQVSSSTTSVMSLVSSLSNIVHHIILGNLPYNEGLAVFLVGMAGGATGRIGALHITKLFGRPSFLIFVLGVILAISGLILFSDVFTEPSDFALANLCSQ